MLISLNWLTDYVDISLSAKDLGELFTQIGLNLEGITETDTDIVFDLEVTSNRPDLLSHLGVAREISAATGAKFHPPTKPALPQGDRDVASLTSVEILDNATNLCSRYTARVITGVKVSPSPAWLVEKLESIGMRSINNIVDITNFILMECSQPLHCFDYDKLAEHKIIVRQAEKGEQITSIDGTQCELTENMLVIADAEKPVAIAGVMGGSNTEVGDSTTNVLIESARFDPLNIRKTSRKLQLMSESNYRFERGIDPIGIETASARACELICKLAGGTLARGVVDVWPIPFTPVEVSLRPARCDALLGITTAPTKQLEILAGLGLSPRFDDDGTIICTIPSYRHDLVREVDLIEEVARLVGYDQIPIHDKLSITVASECPKHRVRKQIGEALSASGFDESLTFAFIDASEAALFGWAETIKVSRRGPESLRPTLLPSLLQAARKNQVVGNSDLSLFELASVFTPTSQGSLPDEYVQIGLLHTGDLRDVRGAIEAMAEKLSSGSEIEVRQEDARGFTAGQSGEIYLDGNKIGLLGSLNQEVLDYYDIEIPIVAATVRFDAMLAIATDARMFKPVPKFPPMKRDLSLIISETVSWADICWAINAIDQPSRETFEYVTTYRGKQIGKGNKSVTITITYRSSDGTLRRQQADELVEELLDALKDKFNAKLRS